MGPSIPVGLKDGAAYRRSFVMDFEKRFRVPDHGFRLADRDPADTAGLSKNEAKVEREADVERLAQFQERLYAAGQHALLVVLQGLDAAGKDGTIKHVMSGLHPQGVSVTPFKPPTRVELAHDYLWRTQVALPPRGHIGVFNRSHYEEVLVVRVHPELLAGEAVDPTQAQDSAFWEARLQDVAAWERHLTRSGTRIVKFFLHLSKAEQRKRFLARAERPDKQWKFSVSDLREHQYWEAYQAAYDAALRTTSTAQEPWYVIPGDHKWFSRTAVAAIVVHHLSAIDPQYPQPSEAELAEMVAAVAELRAEDLAARRPSSGREMHPAGAMALPRRKS
jgi:PPK2 family polyphosphate:nucleotide phosphotransferase